MGFQLGKPLGSKSDKKSRAPKVADDADIASVLRDVRAMRQPYGGGYISPQRQAALKKLAEEFKELDLG